MDVLSRPAEEFTNDETLEHLWATKAIEYSDVYFNMLCSLDTRWLQLTPHDDLIYTHFKQDFSDMDVTYINENEIKNNINKAKWRMFCEKFKNIVEDYSFGTLIRADCKGQVKGLFRAKHDPCTQSTVQCYRDCEKQGKL